MRNEKKHSRTQPQNADNNSRDKEKKTLKKCSDPPCKSQAIMVESSIMNNNNTLTKKGEKIMCDFDNGIFRTIPHDTIDGAVWLTRVADGERITFCRTQSDVMFCVGEMMKQRLGL